MRPFLLLTTRDDEAILAQEVAAFRSLTGLGDDQLVDHRLDRAPLVNFDPHAWSGVLLGGSPYNSTDPLTKKSPTQRRVEQDLHRIMDTVVDNDVPFLGTCYGVAVLGGHQGAVIDRAYGEPAGLTTVELTSDGSADPLLAGLPATFDALTGHKESCSALPAGATLLATSATCPVQMFRVGTALYATQFHPELDGPGIAERLEAYPHHGYAAPEQVAATAARLRAIRVPHPPTIIRRFVDLFRS